MVHARARSCTVPQALRSAATQAFLARWSALLTASALRASLILQDAASHTSPGGDPAELSILLEQSPDPPHPVSPSAPDQPPRKDLHAAKRGGKEKQN